METDYQIDSGRARVTRYHLAPGASIGLHRHSHDYVIVPITSGSLRITEAGRGAIAKGGTAYFRSGSVGHNVGKADPQEMMFVEVKILG